MAMTNCPECGGSLSDKAAVCPHCGYPMNKQEGSPEKAYVLKHAPNQASGAGIFFRVLAWILWIGGLFLSIASSVGTEAVGRYSSATTFNWVNFISLLLSYALYGGLVWCAGLLFDHVSGIYNVLSTLSLERTEGVKKEAKPFFSGRASGLTGSGTWKCKRCGELNREGKLYCTQCNCFKE